MLHIRLFGQLRLQLKQEDVTVAWQTGDTVRTVLERLGRQLGAPVLQKLVDERDEPRPGVIVLVNRRNIHHLQGVKTPLADGDILACFPPGAGG